MLDFGLATRSRRLISGSGITHNDEGAYWNFTFPSGKVVYIGQVVVEVEISVSGVINGHCDIRSVVF
jgi:hypothetical protein